MKCYYLNAAILAANVLTLVHANNSDRFNYGDTDGRDFGLEDWNKVSCDDPTKCEGFGDSWDTAIGWDLIDTNKGCEVCTDNDVENNNCEWCPEDGNQCAQHRQSPIDLMRDRGLFDHPNEKECPDWHWMKYRDGSCTWNDLVDNDDSIHRNNFLIRRHSLQILQPVDKDGNLECVNETMGGRIYPRLDYSKGFPDWWHLAHTEVSVPSEHTQEGKRYDAEVTLAHFYETDAPKTRKNQLGKVVVFLEAFDEIEPWPMLDKLICQWRETEEATRADCGLDSVTTYYPGCRNYDRGHTPAPVDPPTEFPTASPVTASPVTSEPTTARPTPAAPFVMQAPQDVTPTTSRPVSTTGMMGFQFNPCNICGDDSLRISNEKGMVTNFPAFPPMTCRQFENAGAFGLLDPAFCSIFPVFITVCACAPVSTIGSLEMSLPPANTASPVTVAPVASLPSGSSAPSSEPSAKPSVMPFTLSPTVSDSTSGPTDLPTAMPVTAMPTTGAPTTPSPTTLSPSKSPVSAAPSNAPVFVPPPPFGCPDFSEEEKELDLSYRRICKAGSCCDEDRRSATDFCHDAYSLFGEQMPSVCFHCCEEPKIMAPAPPPHPEFEPIDCSAIDNPRRICNPNKSQSCCGERSDTQFCQSIYRMFPGDLINSVCWYCCEEPTTVEPAEDEGNRRLGAGSNLEARKTALAVPTEHSKERRLELIRALSQSEETDDERFTALHHTNADARMHHMKVEPANKAVDNEVDDDKYFKTLMGRHLQNEAVVKDESERARRRLVNYEDVTYWPYEWLLKVKTEYYFRYEGTQAVPPCKDQVHWRVMKDPIPIARRQLDELERLMGERIAPEDARFKQCENDNAGKLREGTTNKYDFARPVQEFHSLHRKVFCECKDWKSKFPEDRGWCNRNIFDRFYSHPYNFDSSEF